jgi:UDP-glucose 4-epimerase
MNSKSVLITGVAGFIGTNLAERLLLEGHIVIGIDNFSYGYSRNLINCFKYPQFKFLEANVQDDGWDDKIKADIIVHLASQKIPRYTNALKTLEENNLMLKKVIQKALSDGARLVFASTSDVYGKNPNIPFHEESDLVLGPTTVKRWAYALSKIYSEQYIQACNAEYGLEYTIMRFFGSYGEYQNITWWGGPQSVFIQNYLEQKPVELHGDGQQTRTFTYVQDTISGVMLCIFKPEAKNEIFNIAGNPDEEITIESLARTIWALMDKEGEPPINLIPYSTFGNYEDVRRRVPSIEKIKKLLGYEPKYTLLDGLKRTIIWQRSLIDVA